MVRNDLLIISSLAIQNPVTKDKFVGPYLLVFRANYFMIET